MKVAVHVAAEQFQLVGHYENLRRTLLEPAYNDHLSKPLAFWVLPADRRLPLAFLTRKLGDLLACSYEQLARTPGIGHKKMASLLKLLARAAKTTPEELPLGVASSPKTYATSGSGSLAVDTNGFDPNAVSEIEWGQWRETIIRFGLGKEKLGRLAPSLKNLTHVIWNATFSAYTDLSLADMRSLRTHGEKRIWAILEVFYSIHQLIGGMGTPGSLVVRLAPFLIDRVEQWVGRALQRAESPSEEEIAEHFIQPLIDQIRMDANEQIVTLAEYRLGINGPITSVRQAARTMGLTRARVYQLLNEINDIITVRWPLGRHQVHELRAKFEHDASQMTTTPSYEQFGAAVELFYPGSRRGAYGSIEPFGKEKEEDQNCPEEMLVE